jgi:molybdopterin synthase catalytic subunit
LHLTGSPIDLAPLLAEARASDGAIALFVGIVRNENAGKPTSRVEYQAYGEMAESEIEKIAAGLAREWPQVRVRILHRVGLLEIGEASVVIVATSPHRAEAFAACRAAIDRVKTTVPIWKKEFHPDGSSDWVDPTKSGAA